MDDSEGPGDASDGELARLVTSRERGAPEAEGELCRRLGPRVRLYGLRHLRDEAAADDLVQDVLVLTLERLRAGRLREPDRLASFVLGACRLIVRNQRRGRRRREVLVDRFPGAFPHRTEPDLLLLDRGRLRDCLARLGERERSVLVLTFYVEEPSGAIATRLGMSAENVRTVRHRAFVHLRACVQGSER
jgi:RNA polymerase sigma-70 factor, ECF subfamily